MPLRSQFHRLWFTGRLGAAVRAAAAALLLALPVTLATPGAIPVLAAPVQPSGASAPMVSCMMVTLTSDSGPNTLPDAVACAAAGPG